jgi:hypothetical protein
MWEEKGVCPFTPREELGNTLSFSCCVHVLRPRREEERSLEGERKKLRGKPLEEVKKFIDSVLERGGEGTLDATKRSQNATTKGGEFF